MFRLMFRLLKLKLVQQELRDRWGAGDRVFWVDGATGQVSSRTCTISKTPMASKLCRRSSPRRLREAVTSSISGTIQQ